MSGKNRKLYVYYLTRSLLLQLILLISQPVLLSMVYQNNHVDTKLRFELVTLGFELATCGFELVTLRFELVTHKSELVTRVLIPTNFMTLSCLSYGAKYSIMDPVKFVDHITQKTISLLIFQRLSSTNFTWTILEYFASYEATTNSPRILTLPQGFWTK